MLTFTDYEIDLRSIPGEICLTFYVCDCPCHCQGCSSPWLWHRGQYELAAETLQKGLIKYPYVSCILLMGGDNDYDACMKLADFAEKELHVLAAMYSGAQYVDAAIMRHFSYFKLGPWIETLGPLNCSTTNQVLWKRVGESSFTNITHLFWTKQNEWKPQQEEKIKKNL